MPREGCLQDDGTTQSQSLVHGGPGVSKPFISGFLALVPSPFLFATFTGRLCPGPDHFRYGTAGEICTKGPGPFGWGNLGPGSQLSGPCTVGSSSPPPLTPPQLPRPGPPTPALTAEAAPWRGRGCCSPGPCAARAAAAAPAAPTAGFPERAQPSAGPRAGPAGALLPAASGGGRGDSPPPGPTEQPQGVTKENRPLSVLQVGKPRLREAGNQRRLWDTTGGQGAPAGCSLGSPGGFYNVLTPWPHPGTTGS